MAEEFVNTWGVRPCRKCNPTGLVRRLWGPVLPLCEHCDGSGWTEWPALATEPYTEIIIGLWIGGYDYSSSLGGFQIPIEESPESRFDVVVDLYHRDGAEPHPPTIYRQFLFPDAALTGEAKRLVEEAGMFAFEHWAAGCTVLVRCRGGLNRSGLVLGTILLRLGYSGVDAVQTLRGLRSPWALCNKEYETSLLAEDWDWVRAQ